MRTTTFVVVISLLNAALYHWPLAAFAIANLDGLSRHSLLTLSSLAVAVFIFTATLLFVLALLSDRLLKPAGMLMSLGNSIALYFIATYQVVLDRTMMGNVFNTRLVEAGGYLHPKLLLFVCLFGILPGWLLTRIRIKRLGRWRLALHGLITLGAGLGWIYLASSSWLWFDDHAKKLGGMVMPWSYVVNTARYQAAQMRASRKQLLLPPATFVTEDKTLVVLVIGETARAQNFSLYGYHRNTNPLLAAAGAIALKPSLACATYTTASLRCILSPFALRSEFAQPVEPLPSYLHRHGVDVAWRSNNWGEPPIQASSYQLARDLREQCNGDDCAYDNVLLTGLHERIVTSTQSRIFVVLHQRGSHGPAYSTEYPPRFQVFSPVCESVDLEQCTQSTLINAYDNTIVYNDYFLSEVIKQLASLTDTSAVLIYISDHGESLGEYGIYLHGTPFSIAPDVQKEVPFIVWISPAFLQRNGLSASQISGRGPYSQRNVFHSVMGAFDMRSAAYEPQFDIFRK